MMTLYWARASLLYRNVMPGTVDKSSIECRVLLQWRFSVVCYTPDTNVRMQEPRRSIFSSFQACFVRARTGLQGNELLKHELECEKIILVATLMKKMISLCHDSSKQVQLLEYWRWGQCTRRSMSRGKKLYSQHKYLFTIRNNSAFFENQ